MEIKFTVPDFIPPQRIIHIIAGIERIGYVLPNNGGQFVKVSRCSHCGKCCKRIDCEYLEKEVGNNDLWKCSIDVSRPFLCCISEPKKIDSCTSKYEET